MTEATEDRPGGEIVVYEAPDGEIALDVRLDQETVWLTREQMGAVFASTTENIRQHLQNVFGDDELVESATTKDFLVVRSEGSRRVRRRIRHYSLDAIISVGYRVNSKRAVRFRRWATRTLREHLVRGQTLNHKRLAERGVREARETLELLSRTLRNRDSGDDAGRTISDVIVTYTATWRLLLEYDEDRLEAPAGTQPPSAALDHGLALDAIADLKTALMARGEATPLFGNPLGDGLEGILGNVEQTMFGEALYRSREEKAAHLLYFLVKNHPFTDGNKRIGSLLFLLYAAREGIEHELNSQALTALTLLIAESAPANKDLMVRLIANLLVKAPE